MGSGRSLFSTSLILAFMLSGVAAGYAQVTLTASSGTASGSFTTLKGAFDAINAGNSFYETTSFAPTATATYKAINISTVTESGNGFTVSGSYTVQVQDMTGRLVATSKLEHTSINGKYRVLQATRLSPGQYILRLLDAYKQPKEKLRMMVE